MGSVLRDREGSIASHAGRAAALASLVLLGAWEAATRWRPSILFPAPSAILEATARMASDGRLFQHLGATLARVSLGFVIGAAPAFLLGLVMGSSERLRSVLDPFVAALHAMPKIALLPLAIVALGIGEPATLALVSVSAFFPLLLATIAGVHEISPIHFEVARAYGASRVHVLGRVVLPGSLPVVLVGVRLAWNTAFLITIAVELVSARLGVGTLIWRSWQTLRVEEMFVGLFLAGLLGVASAAGLNQLFAFLVPWRTSRAI